MRPQLALQTLEMFWNTNKRAVRLVGQPGVGKTSLVKAFAKNVGAEYQHIHVPTKLVEDFGVLNLFTDSDKFGYKMPDWFPMDPDQPVVICLDDASQAGNDLQKLEANMKQERELHGHRFPDQVMIVATGNRVEDRAGVVKQLSHNADRETMIPVEVSLEDWSRWAADEGGAKNELLTFFQFRPELLHDFKSDREKNATPRSWMEGVNPFIGICDPAAELEVYAGAVGEGAAAEFTGFLRVWRELPDPRSVIKNPEGYTVPDGASAKYALCGALAELADKNNFGNVLKAFDRLPPEFGVLGVQLSIRGDDGVTETKEFIDWSVDNADLLW